MKKGPKELTKKALDAWNAKRNTPLERRRRELALYFGITETKEEEEKFLKRLAEEEEEEGT